MLHAVIMAGGSGKRFWPLSRRHRPKHLLKLAGDQTLIRQTVRRIAPLVSPERTWVITGAGHASEVRAQLAELPEGSIVVEPYSRDTAACIGLAATIIGQRDPEATMVVLPADHLIEPADGLRRTVQVAATLVEEDPSRLVTLGIKPDKAATGYGYIQRGVQVQVKGGCDMPVYAVKSFREKPAVELAEQFLQSGQYYWNSGIFVWRAVTILDQLRDCRRELYEALERMRAALEGPKREKVIAEEYECIERISIDYAVMERAGNVVVIEAGFRWDDVGSWGILQRLWGSTSASNTVIGNHCGLHTHDSIVVTDADHLVATLGADHLIIVQSGNVTLVANRRDEESVKQLVELVQEQGMEKYL